MVIVRRQSAVATLPTAQPREMKEAALFPAVKAELEAQGYTVYAEVPWPVGAASIDVVALADGRWPVIVELKTGFTRKLAQQAYIAQLITPYVYATAPTRPRPAFLAMAKKAGFGVAQVRNDEVVVIQKPRIRKNWWPRSGPENEYRRRVLTSCHRSNGYYESRIGGVPNQKGTGPAQMVWRAVQAYRAEHPNAAWRELFENVPNHYAHARSMQGAMRIVEERRAADG